MHNKSKNDIVTVLGFEGTWNIFHEVEFEGHTRYIAENLKAKKMIILSCRNGIYHRSAGPTSWEDAQYAATKIIFNRGSQVDALKIIAGAYLTLALRQRAANNSPQTKEKE